MKRHVTRRTDGANWAGRLLLALAAAVHGGAGWAASVSQAPRGDLPELRQLRLQFSAPVVPAGDPRLPAPASLHCQGEAAPQVQTLLARSAGRWSSASEWVQDLAEPLPGGLRCSLRLDPAFKPLDGPLSGPREFAFGTGAVQLRQVRPWPGSQIEEDQHFLLQLNAPLSAEQVQARAWCEVEGLGERQPVRLVGGEPLQAVLKSEGQTAEARRQPGRYWLLHCQRPLPQEAKVQLMWSRSPSGGDADAAGAQSHAYTVRRPFQAEFSCERERASAPCLSIRPLRLSFSAPLAREQALKARLRTPDGRLLAPQTPSSEEGGELSQISFPVPLAENSSYTLELPSGLKDSSGRPLANAASFPLKLATGAAPPLAKFAAAPFAVLEREAEGPALLPITVRHVQSDWAPATPGQAKAPAGEIRIKRLDSDAEVLAWYLKLRRHHETQLSAKALGLPPAQWQETVVEPDARGRSRSRQQPRMVATREVGLLAGDAAAQRLPLPLPAAPAAGGEPRPFEVIGLPLSEPGYHVVELSSRRLGQSLLDKAKPVYVRTGVLVTNLGVHFKWSRENSLIWVSSLDRGQPVAQAELAVYDCVGKPLWQGRSDAQGLARVPLELQLPSWREQRCEGERGFFVTARQRDAGGRLKDMAFVFSNWNRGIEPWRFNLPTQYGEGPASVRAHTVLDRSLLRAGETVSMKHFFRIETLAGLRLAPPAQWPTRVKLSHEGSGTEFELPLQWSGGGRSAVSEWRIPAQAKLGVYRISLLRDRSPGAASDESGSGPGQGGSWDSGEFRVEEFRVPLISATLSGPKTLPVAPKELRLSAQLNYQAGGPLAQAPLKLSAVLRPRLPSFSGYEDFVFAPPRSLGEGDGEGEGGSAGEDDGAASDGAARSLPAGSRLLADKQAAISDRQGAAELLLKNLPPLQRPSELQAELSYSDPNGEIRSVTQTLALWPAQVVAGLRADSWASNREGRVRFKALALDTQGRPLAGQRLQVSGQQLLTLSSRKRMVGGFYAYDNHSERKPLGTLCSGSSDARGLLDCEVKLDVSGEVELVVSAQDGAGRSSTAASTVWISRQGELWFAQDNDDRIDVLPEKKRYEPGETARFQVRMPFREATALVTVEREGVISSQLVQLRGTDPSFELKIDRAWAPNVYVSVLALRGRIQHVPWYSFFSWGWKAPRNWWQAWRESRAMPAPTALVDLAKPSFKLGVAAVQVGLAAHQLQVTVTPEKSQYGVRETVRTRVKVSHAGQPMAGAEIAFAAVDEGLLALRGNSSWDLLPALIQQRSWGVETATAQSEIIGRRHYGRKAVAAGGGGGRAPTRELLDTLLLWRPVVQLDARGEAVIEVPLNDSLSSFRLVAMADAGSQQFGTGQATVRVSQDLQLLSGLPPVVREGDQFQAALTLRNSSGRAMRLRASLSGQAEGPAAMASAPALQLPAQELELAAGAARELLWALTIPQAKGGAPGPERLRWEAAVEELPATAGRQTPARDRLRVSQRVLPAVPVQVLQASLSQLDGSFSQTVAPPQGAWPEAGPASERRGGINLVLQRRLGGDLPGLRRFFETYPYSCLEQLSSKALGLHDAALWQGVLDRLPGYLDADGLASYFPAPADQAARGSERLTAYLLAVSHEAGREIPAALREKMLDGLQAFVDGRLRRPAWSPRNARLDAEVRRLAALEALSRYGRATPAGLSTVDAGAMASWPTAALIDWLNIHKRMKTAPERERRLQDAQAQLRGRLSYSGTQLRFSTEDSDAWWWLMDSADGNAARLLLAVLDEPAWAAELPRLLQGHLARQRLGAWGSTTANLWSVLALDKFAARFESARPVGRSEASLGAARQSLDWSRQPEGGTLLLPWASGELKLTQQGSGKPWLTVQSLAAVPLKTALSAGYRLQRSLLPVEQKTPGRWSRGDVLRVRLELEASAELSWVVLADPLPTGGAILAGGTLAQQARAVGETAGSAESAEAAARIWPSYEERSQEAWRAYFEQLPRGRHVLEYTLRLNNAGRFLLPGTRVEAMYAPENFAELPQQQLEVAP